MTTPAEMATRELRANIRALRKRMDMTKSPSVPLTKDERIAQQKELYMQFLPLAIELENRFKSKVKKEEVLNE